MEQSGYLVSYIYHIKIYNFFLHFFVFREDKKLKMDMVKNEFKKHLVEAEWTC